MSVLAAAAVLGLVTSPVCGGLSPGGLADRITAHALRESGGDPLAIGVNPDRERKLPQYAVHPNSQLEAVQAARSLLAAGRTIGLGLMQIDSSQLVRHGLSIEAAFDQCGSIRAGIEHYSADLNAATVYLLASKRYNTGSFERGDAYARGVEMAVERVRREIAGAPAVPITVEVAQAPLPLPQPSVAPSRPAAWDVYATTAPVPLTRLSAR